MSDADSTAWIVREGQEVLASDGKKIGEVTGSAGSALVVKHGFLFTAKELYIPVSAIASIDPQAVHLNVPAEDATSEAWRRMPDGAAIVPNVQPETSDPAEAPDSDSGTLTITEGMAVIDANGERIGEVEDGSEGAITVRVGRFFAKTISIAAAEIGEVRDGAVHILTTKANFGRDGAPSQTPLTDLQGRITNAWRGTQADLDAGIPAVDAGQPDSEFPIVSPAGQTPYTPPADSTDSTSALDDTTAIGESPDTELAAEARELDSMDGPGDAGYPDLPSDPFAGDGDRPEDPEVASTAIGSTDSGSDEAEPIAPPVDLPGDISDDAPLTSTETAAMDEPAVIHTAPAFTASPLGAAEPEKDAATLPPADTGESRQEAESPAAASGLIGQIRNRISTFFDKPENESPAASDETANARQASEASAIAGAVVAGASARTEDASIHDTVSTTPDVEVDATIPDVPAASAEAKDADEILSDDARASVHAEDASILDDASNSPGPESLEAEAYAQELYVSDPDINGFVRTVVPDAATEPSSEVLEEDTSGDEHHEGFFDDLRAKIEHVLDNPDAAEPADEAVSEDTIAPSTDSSGPAPSRYSIVADHDDDDDLFDTLPNDTSDETPPPAEVLASDVRVEGASDRFEALAGDAATNGDVDFEIDESASELIAPETDLKQDSPEPETGEQAESDLFAAAVEAAAGNDIDAFGTPDEHQVADESTTGSPDTSTEPAAESEVSFSPTSDDELLAAVAPSDDASTTPAEPSPEADVQPNASDTESSAATDADEAVPDSTASDTSSATSSEEASSIEPEPLAGDTTIAENAASGDLADAAEAVDNATKQDQAIARNAVTGTLAGASDLARTWASGEAASTASNAQARIDGRPATVAGATPLAADAAPDDSAATEPSSHDPAPAAALHGPAETEGIDWVAAVDGEGEPNGWLVKGNADSGIYHTPESSSYERTRAEVWFPDAEAAERSGYRAPRTAHHAGEQAVAASHAAAAAVDTSASTDTDASNDEASSEAATSAPDAGTSGDDAPEAFADEAATEPSDDAATEPPSKGHGPADTEGIDWAAAVDGKDAPNGWLVKGNANSGIYHTPESSSYERTIPEVWFPDAEAAERSGYRAPRTAHHAGETAVKDAGDAAHAAVKETDKA
ncbi:MAG: DUF2171 domain-containing protein [Thermomicrobiales bacterium]